MRRGAALVRTSMSVWIVASLLLCRESEEGNEWTRASQSSVNLFKLIFFSSFNARPEASVVHRVLSSAVVHETLCKSTLYCGKIFELQTCDYFGTEGIAYYSFFCAVKAQSQREFYEHRYLDWKLGNRDR